MRLVSPDRGCIEADVGPRRYKGTILNVEDPYHAKVLKEVGYFEANLGGQPKGRGHQCSKCHRYNYLPTCGRCG